MSVERRALRAVLRLTDLDGVGDGTAGEAEAEAEVALRFDLVVVDVGVDSVRRLRGLGVTGSWVLEDIVSVEELTDLAGE